MSLNQFDRVAPIYDRLARLVFGQRLTLAQEVYLSEILAGSRVLILGGGTGKIIGALLKVRPDCQVTFVDASRAMLRRAMQRNMGYPNIEYVHGTEQSIPPGTAYDVVMTPFYLDMFREDQLPDVIRHIGRAIDLGGNGW